MMSFFLRHFFIATTCPQRSFLVGPVAVVKTGLTIMFLGSISSVLCCTIDYMPCNKVWLFVFILWVVFITASHSLIFNSLKKIINISLRILNDLVWALVSCHTAWYTLEKHAVFTWDVLLVFNIGRGLQV